MSQTRLLDYGANVLSSQVIAITKANNASGVLTTTPVLEIGGNSTLQVNPYSVITPDGVIISENTVQSFPITLSAHAANYTVVVNHALQQTTGGSAASIQILNNLLPTDGVTNGTVLGWLVYPGSSVVLDSTMLYFPRSLKNVEASDADSSIFQMSAPFSSKWFILNSDPNLSVSEVYSAGKAFTRITNTHSIIVGNSIFLIPVVSSTYQPTKIRISARADFQAGLTVTVFDENGLQYIPANNIISNTDWGVFEVQLPNVYGLNVFKPQTTWLIRFSFQLNPTAKFDIQSVSVNDYNIPVGQNNIPGIQYTFNFVRLSSVLNFYSPALALPSLPALGDSYIASAAGNGWLKSHIYTWNGASWTQTTPVLGNIVRISQAMPLEDYVFSGDFEIGWVNSIPQHLILV